MGILANTVSICHFRVQGQLVDLEAEFDFISAAPQLLARHAFTPIDDSLEEISIGWVHLEDPKEHGFADASTCWREKYLAFSLRRDQRKVPTALLKEHLDKACELFLEENPNFTRVPKLRKEELKEQVRIKLLAKMLPDPKVYDLVWDTERNVVTFTTFSPKMVEILEDLFKQTFEGLRLTALHPYERAMTVLPDQYRPLLTQANRAAGDSFLELIQENKWIGTDFMRYLLYQTMNSDSEYKVCCTGPQGNGTMFVAYMNDKVVLDGASPEGHQTVTIKGPQVSFSEVKNAMLGGKVISESTIHLENGDDHYTLTLKGGVFHFASFSTPAVKIEKDNTVDEQMEREAVFFERMALLEKGLQLFDSLFAAFLVERLGPEWHRFEGTIGEWLEAA